MIIKRILARLGNKNAKNQLREYFSNKLSIAVVVETRTLDDYQNTASNDTNVMAKKAEDYFLAKWAREELEKKVKQYA